MAYHHGNLRAELVARAEQVLAADGVDAITLRALARDLGVSHAAPGRHFADRLALLDALAADGFDRLNRQLVAPATAAGTFDQRLHATARAYMKFAGTYPALLELMYARKQHGASPEVRTASDACAHTLLSLLAAKEAPIDDPERFGIIMLACLQGIAALAVDDGLPAAYNPNDLADDAVDRLLRGSR